MAEHKIPEEQIAAARQVSLLDYLLRHDPDLLVRKGNEYRTPNGHSSLSISADGSKWIWFAGHIGGYNALDYLTKVEKIPFLTAVELLTGSGVSNQSLPRPAPAPQAEKQPFSLPPPCRYSDRVLRYLTGRGIDRDIVQHCIKCGTIYESYHHHNVVFVGKDPSGTPKFACLRGTTDEQFRIDQESSDKRFGFLYVPPGCDPHSQRCVAAFEAPIDALSFVTLNRRYHIHSVNWDRLPCLSLSGTAHVPLLQYLQDHPRTDTVYLCLDNDSGGQKGVKWITQAIRDNPDLSKQVRHIVSCLPSSEYGKDYNDMLQKIIAERRAALAPAPRPPNRDTLQ